MKRNYKIKRVAKDLFYEKSYKKYDFLLVIDSCDGLDLENVYDIQNRKYLFKRWKKSDGVFCFWEHDMLNSAGVILINLDAIKKSGRFGTANFFYAPRALFLLENNI